MVILTKIGSKRSTGTVIFQIFLLLLKSSANPLIILKWEKETIMEIVIGKVLKYLADLFSFVEKYKHLYSYSNLIWQISNKFL